MGRGGGGSGGGERDRADRMETLRMRDIMARRADGNESFLHTFAYRVMHF